MNGKSSTLLYWKTQWAGRMFSPESFWTTWFTQTHHVYCTYTDFTPPMFVSILLLTHSHVLSGGIRCFFLDGVYRQNASEGPKIRKFTENGWFLAKAPCTPLVTPLQLYKCTVSGLGSSPYMQLEEHCKK